MARTLLNISLYLCGLIIIGVGGSIIAIGPDQTAQNARVLADILLGDTREITDFKTVNVDSEFRFYAGIFVGYGMMLLHTAATMRRNIDRVPALAGIFLLGGIGRAVSLFQVGDPHGLFSILLWLEIGVPILLFMLYQSARNS